VNFRDRLVFFLNNIHPYDDDYCKGLAELLPHNFNENTSDSQLFRKIKSGLKEAYRQLFERYAPGIYKWIILKGLTLRREKVECQHYFTP